MMNGFRKFCCIAILFCCSQLVSAQVEDSGVPNQKPKNEQIVDEENQAKARQENTLSTNQTLNTKTPQAHDIQRIPPDFKEKYKGKDYEYAQKADYSLSEMLRDFFRDLINSLFNIKDDKTADKIIDIIIYVFSSLLLIALIYFIVRAYLRKETRGALAKKAGTINEVNIEMEQVIEKGNFADEIRNFESQKDYRSAIRYHFAWLLKEWDKKNIIQYRPEKSASTYKYEIKNNLLGQQFDYALYLFDNIWYGAFEINTNEYNNAAQFFSNLIHYEK